MFCLASGSLNWETRISIPGQRLASASLIFERELNAAGKELGIEVGRIIPKPIHALVQYHLDYVLKQQII
jgi:hypothetical protein